jgi:uncharacterized membrane protein
MNQNIKFILLSVLILGLVLPLVNANVLVSTTLDRENFYQNEVGMLTIKLFNDSDKDLDNLLVRIEGSEGIVFVNNFDEEKLILKETGIIRKQTSKELLVKIKIVSIQDPTPKIFVYYGSDENPKNAAVTFVNAKESKVTIKTSPRRINSNEGEKIIIDFSVTNYSTNAIYDLGAEVIALENYIIKTPPLFQPILQDGNVEKISFELLPPPEANGNQKIVLSYAYTDENGWHYFEEIFTINIERMNHLVLAVLGIGIIVIAGYLYVLRDKKSEKSVKGTEED